MATQLESFSPTRSSKPEYLNPLRMAPTTARTCIVWSLFLGVACFIVIGAYGENLPPRTISGGNYHEAIRRLHALKASLTRHDSIASAPSSSYSLSSSPSPLPSQVIQLCSSFSLVHFSLGKFIKCLMLLFVSCNCRV